MVAAAFAACFSFGSIVAHAAPGDVDTTFGTAGLVMVPLLGTDVETHAVTHDRFGRLIVAGNSTDDVLGRSMPTIARFLPDGTLDTTFGGGGIVISVPPGGLTGYAQLYTVAIDSKDRIVAGGAVSIEGPFGSTEISTVVRYLPDGTLDSTFGSDGFAQTIISAGEQASVVQSLTVDDKDKIIAVGYSYNMGDTEGVVIRYNEDGGLDHTFAHSGIVIENGYGSFRTYGVSLDSAGRIVVVGQDVDPFTFVYDTFVGRYLENGDPDASFGTDGSGYATSTGIEADALVIDASDNVLVAGFSNSSSNVAIARFGSDGVLDTAFGTDGSGISETDYEDLSYGHQLAIDSKGNILASATLLVNFATFRFTSDGVLDSGFGTDGAAFAPNLVDADRFYIGGFTIDGADHFTVAGWTNDGTSGNFVLTRFEN